MHIFPPVFPKYFLDFSSLQCQCFFINCLQCINLSTLFVYVSLYNLRILFPDLNTWNETEIGLGLTAFGVFFSFLGIIFLFDKGLLAMGNVSGDALKKQLCSFSFLLPSYCKCNHVRTLTWAFCVILNQILFLLGVMLTIGLRSTMQFFTKRQNYKVQLFY